MMDKKKTDIIKDVRVCLDMNSNDEKLVNIQDIATLELNEIIVSKILEGLTIVEMNAALELMDNYKTMSGTIAWEQREKWVGGVIALPTDYMRLYAFKMSDWDRAVHEPITVADDKYAMQKSRYGGVRGNTQDPVVAIVPSGKLEFYSCKDNKATIDVAQYIPIPSWVTKSGNDVVSIPERLYSSVVYEIARLVSVTIAQDQMARGMDALSDEFLASNDVAPVAIAAEAE